MERRPCARARPTRDSDGETPPKTPGSASHKGTAGTCSYELPPPLLATTRKLLANASRIVGACSMQATTRSRPTGETRGGYLDDRSSGAVFQQQRADVAEQRLLLQE